MKENKILEINELAKKIQVLKSEGNKIVHCHGCFDLMHPGHIKYFQAAKKMGNILVVTVTRDIYVDKGHDRPVFNQTLRAESIAALECVDYVAINKWPTAEETLRLLRPHIYVKGQEFENLEDKTGKIQREYKVIQEIGAETRFTHEIVFSSTENKLIYEKASHYSCVFHRLFNSSCCNFPLSKVYMSVFICSLPLPFFTFICFERAVKKSQLFRISLKRYWSSVSDSMRSKFFKNSCFKTIYSKSLYIFNIIPKKSSYLSRFSYTINIKSQFFQLM